MRFCYAHGVVALKRPFSGISHNEWAEFIESGGCHVYLGSTAGNGRSIQLHRAFHLLEFLHRAMVVGQGLLESLLDRSLLKGGE